MTDVLLAGLTARFVGVAGAVSAKTDEVTIPKNAIKYFFLMFVIMVFP